MEYIPKFLAQKFSCFESMSVPRFFLLFFGSFIITVIISIMVGEYVTNIIAPIVTVIFFICFIGFVSVQHFSRKPWVPSSPLIVQFTSQPWFNSILSFLSFIRHWGVLVFINVSVVMIVFIIVAAIIQSFGS